MCVIFLLINQGVQTDVVDEKTYAVVSIYVAKEHDVKMKVKPTAKNSC